ncbi:type 4a pilus biogenesis protein PilO [Massilia sp. G4R7]|uniref:Type 4a pilus biogenesis protein PilO n=1 Tax=Massilia phyllostachyos TaxID=2898585 RepID=A0ABS8Q8U3_9BURK|nr:type 4a pilus biogenesis protein PilO [Massilia phyllostachyos]MCD2517025.1 type 4a pilus biogenesis protein PilO [Massilia phyllostachyos]
MNIDLKDLGAQLAAQFQDLQGRQPGQWPLAPRLLCAAGVMALVAVLGYFFYWSGQFETQEQGAAEEQRLREEYRVKMAQAINLEALQAQKAQVDQYVVRLEKQLPSKSEMADLLSDINQAGVGRGLQFELFKPGAEVVRDYYAELPIDIKVVGKYDDVGAFAADMANLPRIVTLNNMAVSGKDGSLQLEAVAKTFRYLDPDEIAAQKKKAREEKMKKQKGGA